MEITSQRRKTGTIKVLKGTQTSLLQQSHKKWNTEKIWENDFDEFVCCDEWQTREQMTSKATAPGSSRQNTKTGEMTGCAGGVLRECCPSKSQLPSASKCVSFPAHCWANHRPLQQSAPCNCA